LKEKYATGRDYGWYSFGLIDRRLNLGISPKEENGKLNIDEIYRLATQSGRPTMIYEEHQPCHADDWNDHAEALDTDATLSGLVALQRITVCFRCLLWLNYRHLT
jgi:hypothetical protein